jgi:hypothetical protein
LALLIGEFLPRFAHLLRFAALPKYDIALQQSTPHIP